MTSAFYFSTSKQTVRKCLVPYLFLVTFFCMCVVVPSSASPQRSVDQRSTTSAPSAPVVNGESNSLTSSVPYPAAALVSQNESENEGHLNPTEKLQ